MTPANTTDKALKEIRRPIRNHLGVCSVCGFTSSHGWECIGYYMNMATDSYVEQMLEYKRVLEDIQIGRTPSKLSASLLLKKVEATKELLDELTKT